jgi:hypothetical protein
MELVLLFEGDPERGRVRFTFPAAAGQDDVLPVIGLAAQAGEPGAASSVKMNSVFADHDRIRKAVRGNFLMGHGWQNSISTRPSGSR